MPVLRHWFTPHHTNNHKARFLHLDVLGFYIFVFLILNFSIRAIHHIDPLVLGFASDIRVDALLSETNVRRQAAGLQTVSLNDALSKAAAEKAADMFANNYWAHISPQGKTPWVFIVNSGYTYAIAGENLAKNFIDSKGVVDAWMNSPSHRDNVLKANYRDVGFAVVNGNLNGEDTTLVVQMFGATAAGLAGNAPKQVTTKVSVPTPAVAGAIDLLANAEPVQVPVAVPVEDSTVQLQSVRVPKVDMLLVTRGISLLFAGLVLSVLIIDAWVVAQKKIVRVSGHNVAHILFFVTILLATLTIYPGSIL